MKVWSAVDEIGTIKRHDSFRYKRVSDGHELEIAVVRHQCFKPISNEMMRNCIVLQLIFSHDYEIISSKFRLETIVLQEYYTFDEFNNILAVSYTHLTLPTIYSV